MTNEIQQDQRSSHGSVDPVALRNESLGFWAAELPGMKDVQAGKFARELFQDTAMATDDEAVIELVRQSLSQRGVTVSPQDIEVQLKRLMNDVMEELR